MSLKLHITPLSGGEETEVILDGPEEVSLTKILAARLLSLDYEVLIEDSDGDMVALEEFEEFTE